MDLTLLSVSIKVFEFEFEFKSLVTLTLTMNETLKWLSPLPTLMQKLFWWRQPRSDRYIISLSPHLHTPFPPFSPSLISLMVSV